MRPLDRARVLLLVGLTAGAGLVGLAHPGPAAALPPSPWAGQWLSGADVITLSQAGAQINGAGPCPGTAGTGVTYTATASVDGASANFTYASSECTGVGGTFTGTMSADGLRINGSGVTQFGTGFSFTWTYRTGGNEPRTSSPPPPPPPPVAPALPAVLCPDAASPWTGRWIAEDDRRQRTFLQLLQSGPGVTGLLVGAESNPPVAGSVAPRPGAGTHLDATASSIGVTFSLDLIDPRTFRGTRTTAAGARPVTGTLEACSGVLGTAPDLRRTIPDPTTANAGPTGATFPGTISLRSLRRSKCVRVVVVSRRPARVLVTIFSGRRSIRVFGQREVRFGARGRRVVCIQVPLRAHTFNVRTPLRFALGYRLGTRPPPGGDRGRAPRPVIKRIRLVP